VAVVLVVVLNKKSSSSSSDPGFVKKDGGSGGGAPVAPPVGDVPKDPEKDKPKEQEKPVGGDVARGPALDIGRRIYNRLLKSTVLIIRHVKEGDREGTVIGTGTLIDKTNRLVLTNYHVVGAGASELFIFFPIFKDGKMVREREHFFKAVDSRKDVLQGETLLKQSSCDLAIVKLDKVPADVEALPLASTRSQVGDPVYSVGHAGAADAVWIFTEGQIRTFTHQKIMVGGGEGVFELDADTVMTTSPTNPGDSGGPVVNGRGELMAVVQSGRRGANLLSNMVDLTEVQKFIAKCSDRYDIKFDLPPGPGIEGDTTGMAENIAALKNRDATKRAEAAKRLGDLGPDAKIAVPDLIPLLKDPDNLVRRFTRTALDKIGPPTKNEVPTLLEMIEDPNATVRIHVVDALGKVGPEGQAALPALTKALKDTDAKVREAAAHAVARVGKKTPEAVVPLLSEALKDSEKTVRVAAAEALAADLTLNSRDVGMLVELLQHQDSEVRVQAAVALKKLGPDAVVAKKPLLDTLKKADTPLRRASLEALATIGVEKEALPELEKALDDKDIEVRRAALNAVAQLGPDAKPVVPLIAKAVTEWKLRKAALDALAKIGPGAKNAQVIKALEEALADPAYRVQAAEVVAAIRPTGPEAQLILKRLIETLKLPDDKEANKEIRAKVIEALVKIGRTGVPTLAKHLSMTMERDHWVRLGVAVALGDMGKDARDALNILFAVNQNDESAEVREAAGKAIEKIRR
jgi:HEAT repeat protein/S1-C subfamily serine protease